MASSDPSSSGSITPATERAPREDRTPQPRTSDLDTDASPPGSATTLPPGEAAAVLREGLITRVQRLAAAYRTSGRFDPDALGEVERLDHVLQAFQRARPPAKAWPWRVPALAVVTAGLVSVLLFVRVPCTEVTLDLTLSSFGFQLTDWPGTNAAGGTSLTGDEIAAARVELKGIDAVEGLPDTPTFEPETDWQAFAAANGLLLGPLRLGSGTWVRLFQMDADGDLPLWFKHEARPVAIEVHLPAGARVLPRSELSRRIAGLDDAVTLEVAAEPQQLLELEITPLSNFGHDAAALFGSELPIAGLDFEWGDPGPEGRRREFSAVRGGSVYLEALGGEEHALRRGEYLHIGRQGELTDPDRSGPLATISRWLAPYFAACQALGPGPGGRDVAGTITAIEINPERVLLQARAAVSVLGVGSRANARDLMPRVLEWLQAHHETKLFWGVFSFLFLFVLLPVMRFWGIAR